MKNKGLIFLFIFIVLILPNLVFASDLNDRIILEEVTIGDGEKTISWELKESVSPGSYFLLSQDFPLEDYDVEKDDFLDLEIVEDSNLIKLIFTEELEEGQEGLISFIEKEKAAESVEVSLTKGKNICDLCNRELTVIEDGRPVCICEEAVIIDLEDMPLKGDESKDNEKEIAANENGDDLADKDKQELEKIDNEEELVSEEFIAENPETLPNTGSSQLSIFIGLIFLSLGFYFRKKLIFK